MDVRDAISFDVAELAVQSILAVDTIPPDTSANGAVFPNQNVSADDNPAPTPVTDPPRLEVAPATGAEDSAIALDLAADLIQPAPGETLTLTVSGLPEGAALSAGTATADGSWTLGPDQLDGLTLTPPAEFHGALSLEVAATATLGADSRSVTAPLAVTVTPVTDPPRLEVAPATGAEDSAIALELAADLIRPAPGETLTLTVSGLPEGAALSAGTRNADGSWSLGPDQLDGLTLTPPAEFHGELSLEVAATATLGADSRSVTAPLAVTVTPVTDAPRLEVAPATGAEDSAIALELAADLIRPAPGETLTLTVSGLPEGAALSAGMIAGVASDGSTTWSLGAADLAGLTLIPPSGFTGDFDLEIAAIASDPDGGVATTSHLLPVTVLAEEPSLPPSSQVIELNGLITPEDTAVALELGQAFLEATGFSNLTFATISGLPEGTMLSAGDLQPDGSYLVSAADLEGLLLTPPNDSDDDMRIAVSFELTDGAQVNAAFDLQVDAVADMPTITISGASSDDVSVIPFNIGGGLSDVDGSETLTRFVSGLPEGARLSAGTYAGDGLWSLTPEDLTGLALRPPTDFFGSFGFTTTVVATEASNGDVAVWNQNVTVTVSGGQEGDVWQSYDARGDEDTAVDLGTFLLLFDLTGFASIAVEGVPEGGALSGGYLDENGDWIIAVGLLQDLTYTPPEHDASDVTLTVVGRILSFPITLGRIDVLVDAVADAPSLSASAVDGIEDQALSLTINGALVDTDGSETLSFAVLGLPEGAVLSAGTRDPASGTWILTPEDLSGLTLTPPPDFSGQLTFDVRANSLEDEGNAASTTETITINILPVTDAASLIVQAAAGHEDQPIPLNITLSAGDADGSENVTAIVISGLPDGAVLSAGTALGAGAYAVQPEDLAGLTITPPANFSGQFDLQVTATLQDGTADPVTVSSSLTVTAAPVADAPVLNVTDALGVAGEPVDLSISAATVVADGTEVLSIVLSGLPEDAFLTAGRNMGGGVWSLDAQQLDGLQLLPPQDWFGEFALTVDAHATIPGTGDIASNTAVIDVQVPEPAPIATEVVVDIAPGFTVDSTASLSRIVVTLADDPLFAEDTLALSDETASDPVISDALSGGALSLRFENDDRQAILEGDAPAEFFEQLVRGLQLHTSSDQGSRTVSIDVYDTAGELLPLDSVNLTLNPNDPAASTDPGDLLAADTSFDAETDTTSLDWNAGSDALDPPTTDDPAPYQEMST
ncbi:hypothetical protein CCR90_13430 [Rhodovulum sulfidophilum]|nr:hypothetical protein [Rhodovulum sulfidophilum]